MNVRDLRKSAFERLPLHPAIDYLCIAFDQTLRRRTIPRPFRRFGRSFVDIASDVNLRQRTRLRAQVANKFLVRSFIQETIGAEHCVPVAANFERISDFDDQISQLEAQLPLIAKPAHGTGDVKFILDVDTLRDPLTRQHCVDILATQYSRRGRVWVYDQIQPSVIFEKVLGMGDEAFPPPDYKFHCVHGDLLFLQFDVGRTDVHQQCFFTPELTQLRMTGLEAWHIAQERPNPSIVDFYPKIQTLAAAFDYVRVDAYLVGNQFYIGELTNVPWAGRHEFGPPAVGHALADYFYGRSGRDAVDAVLADLVVAKS